jgi:hypothetical protein
LSGTFQAFFGGSEKMYFGIERAEALPDKFMDEQIFINENDFYFLPGHAFYFAVK